MNHISRKLRDLLISSKAANNINQNCADTQVDMCLYNAHMRHKLFFFSRRGLILSVVGTIFTPTPTPNSSRGKQNVSSDKECL